MFTALCRCLCLRWVAHLAAVCPAAPPASRALFIGRLSPLLSDLFSELFDETMEGGLGKQSIPGPIFDLSVKRTDSTGWNSLNLKVAFSANLPVLVICKSEKTPQLPETADSLVMCLPLLHRRFSPFQVLCTERKPCRRDLFCLVIVPAVSGRFGEPWRTGKKIIIFQA